MENEMREALQRMGKKRDLRPLTSLDLELAAFDEIRAAEPDSKMFDRAVKAAAHIRE